MTRDLPVIANLRRRLARVPVAAFDVELGDGRVFRLGGAPAAGGAAPAFRVIVRTARGARALSALDESAVAEAYTNGDIDVDGDFMAMLDLRGCFTDRHPVRSLWRFLRPLLFGRIRSDSRWISNHYDHGNELYFTFIDPEYPLYSHGLFETDSDTLNAAVRRKLAYMLSSCGLAAGSHVLDVGAGWGPFARYAAERGVDVTMLTLSREQFAFLDRWSRKNGSRPRLAVVYDSILRYAPSDRYDAIVMAGVMEHLPQYGRVFERCRRLLKEGGRLYMDFAANRTKYDLSSFTYRHIFPGAHAPVVLPDLFAAANATAFETVALHNDRHSYELTLAAWARNLEAARDEVCRRFGDATFRLFRLYLWAGSHLMRAGGASGLECYRVVFQLAPSSVFASRRSGVSAPSVKAS
jgi:cyclopropane-fatty-acyl-phospholipid synthase